MEAKQISAPHSIVIEDRKRVTISGVTDVDSFDEENVILMTDLGELMIHGLNIHINRVDVESGDLSLEGDIYSVSYTDDRQAPGGFFGRLFR